MASEYKGDITPLTDEQSRDRNGTTPVPSPIPEGGGGGDSTGQPGGGGSDESKPSK